MVARLRFGPDGGPINQHQPTRAELIRFHRAQIEHFAGMGPNARVQQTIAHHQTALEQLLQEGPA